MQSLHEGVAGSPDKDHAEETGGRMNYDFYAGWVGCWLATVTMIYILRISPDAAVALTPLVGMIISVLRSRIPERL
jgi:hypothetical protein